MTATAETNESSWEPLLAVDHYWDGPRLGIASFRGRPHFFESQFSDEEQDYTDRFLLMKVTPELRKLDAERRAIWDRWRRRELGKQ